MIDQLEQRVWIAETRLLRLEQATESSRQSLAATRQKLAQAGSVSLAVTCTTTYSGTVKGCGATAQPVPGATVQIVDPGSGFVYDSQTTAADGTYSGAFTLFLTNPALNVVISASGYSTDIIPTTFNCNPASLGTTTLTVDPGACCASFTATFKNCDGSGHVGATVQATISGVLVWQGTTDASGNISGACALPSGASTSVLFTATATTARFAVYTHTYTLACGSNALGNVTFTAATGYVCNSGCKHPIATTLHLTDTLATTTLTWNGATWIGTYAYSFPGCTYKNCVGVTNACAAKSVTITYSWNTFVGMTISGKQVAATGCPDGSAAGSFTVTNSATSHTCPESGAFAVNITAAFGCNTDPLHKIPIYCANSVPITITE